MKIRFRGDDLPKGYKASKLSTLTAFQNAQERP